MENLATLAEFHEQELIPERDVIAIMGMLDYLIAEVGRIDGMAAHCLVAARKSLGETVEEAFIKAN